MILPSGQLRILADCDDCGKPLNEVNVVASAKAWSDPKRRHVPALDVLCPNCGESVVVQEETHGD